MKDRIDKNPNEFEIVPVDGKPGRYTIRKVMDGVEEMGTAWSKANVLEDVVAEMYGMGPDAVPNDIFRLGHGLGSFLAFVASVNANTLDAAFGKGNENVVVGLGFQLVLYARYKGEREDDFPLENLAQISRLSEFHTYSEAYFEAFQSPAITSLLNASPYAKEIFTVAGNIEKNISFSIATLAGLNTTTHTSFSDFFQEPSARTLISVQDAITYAFSKESFVSATPSEFRVSVMRSNTGQVAMRENVHNCNLYFLSDAACMRLINTIETRAWTSKDMWRNSRIAYDGLCYVVYVQCERYGYTAYTSVDGVTYAAEGIRNGTETTTVNKLNGNCHIWGSYDVGGTSNGVAYKPLAGLIQE